LLKPSPVPTDVSKTCDPGHAPFQRLLYRLPYLHELSALEVKSCANL